MSCPARIKPFRRINEVEIKCELTGWHDPHSGTIRDYAYKGSATVITWFDSDRRTYDNEWPGDCNGNEGQCVLPLGHLGRHNP